jgi:hypothetical protein
MNSEYKVKMFNGITDHELERRINKFAASGCRLVDVKIVDEGPDAPLKYLVIMEKIPSTNVINE